MDKLKVVLSLGDNYRYNIEEFFTILERLYHLDNSSLDEEPNTHELGSEYYKTIYWDIFVYVVGYNSDITHSLDQLNSIWDETCESLPPTASSYGAESYRLDVSLDEDGLFVIFSCSM